MGTRLDTRMIEEFGVFVITAIASLWMVVALEWLSKDEINLGEAIFTLAMFPILVVVSYGQDQQWWGWCGADKVSPEDGGGDEAHVVSITADGEKKRRRSSISKGDEQAAVAEALSSQEDGAAPVDPQAAARKAAQDAMRKKKKSRLEYRIQATRKMTGGRRILPTVKEDAPKDALEGIPEEGETRAITLGFEEAEYKCEEGCGQIKIKVMRSGVTDVPCNIQFDTSDGDAVSGDDYVSAKDTLVFAANETEKEISLTIIDDNEWAPDKHFYVRLYNPTHSAEGIGDVVLSRATTQITILNDDDPGVITFDSKTCQALSAKPTVKLKLLRKDGQDGNVLAFLKTVDGTAKAGEDFVALAEDYEVHFPDKLREYEVEIELITNEKNTNSTFTVEITNVMPEGAKVGEINMCTVIITDDKHYKQLMEDVVAMMDDEMDKFGVGTSSWGEQFHDAMNMGGDDGAPEFVDYLMHFLSFYWKALHAIVPPTDMGGGWYTFWVSLMFIGGITCLVGDTAKMLGCCIGLDDSITAITFVALGTSLPDTFASVEATVSDDTADAAITNVTGSNSVNVFLGLGLPWCLAAIYHLANGTTFKYPAGDLVFSVLVFFAFAFGCIGLLFFRRFKCGGELGGHKNTCYLHSGGLAFFWFAYIVISALKTKGHI